MGRAGLMMMRGRCLSLAGDYYAAAARSRAAEMRTLRAVCRLMKIYHFRLFSIDIFRARNDEMRGRYRQARREGLAAR